MFRMRPISTRIFNISKSLLRTRTQQLVFRKFAHHDGPPKPFENMPFNVSNRYVATVIFGLFFGLGLWAPFIVVWYMMAKRSL